MSNENEVLKRTKEVYNKAVKIFGRYGPKPIVGFFTDSLYIGLAQEGTNEIWFNFDVVQRHTIEELNDVIIHEVAHLVTFALHPGQKKPHSKEFREICRKLGGTGSTLIYDLEGTKVRKLTKYLYYCGCRTVPMSKNRHLQVENNKITLRCVRCQNLFDYTGQTRIKVIE